MHEEEEESFVSTDAPAPWSPTFSEVSFWDSRYATVSASFDWFQSWKIFKKSIPAGITLAGTALNVGCGNSTMSADLLESGYVRVLNIDFSNEVIGQMREQYKDEPKLEWVVGNCTKMDDVPSHTYDSVFDKATLDCLACSDNAENNIVLYLNEVNRVLKSTGVFILISFAPEITRLRYFRAVADKLKVTSVIQVPKLEIANSFYYIYILVKINNQ